MKRFHVLLLAFVLLIFSFSPQSIFASSNAKTEITYNPDGSYVITTLNISCTAAYSTSKTASKWIKNMHFYCYWNIRNQ